MKETIVKLTLLDGKIVFVNLANVDYVIAADTHFVVHFNSSTPAISVIDNPFPHLV